MAKKDREHRWDNGWNGKDPGELEAGGSLGRRGCISQGRLQDQGPCLTVHFPAFGLGSGERREPAVHVRDTDTVAAAGRTRKGSCRQTPGHCILATTGKKPWQWELCNVSLAWPPACGKRTGYYGLAVPSAQRRPV